MPLLILWFGYGEREATGTSLAAIVVIALLAAVGQGAYGNVDMLEGLLVGVPAVGGVIAGTALQQRIPRARRSRCCSRVLLVAVADPAAGRLMDSSLAALLGFAGGVLGGLLGVGGGILFVPALAIFLDEPQVRAEATSLLAIVLVGDRRRLAPARLRQRPRRATGRDRRALAAGRAVGVVLANAVSERALEVAFAALRAVVAVQLCSAQSSSARQSRARAPARP